MTVDLTSLFSMVFYWMFYPINNWGFTFAGVSLTFVEFVSGCFIFAMVISFLKSLAGDAGRHLKFINILRGGG